MIELTEEQLENAVTYRDTIRVRFWFDRKVDIRVSEFGPVITDAPFLEHVDKPLAIQWLGHKGTNELRCFLDGSKARNFEEFRAAFKGYAVSGQNLVYADNQGNIGLIAAYTQPLLQDPDKTLDLVKTSDNAIAGGIDSYDLPYSFNPESGFIASANNQPYPTKVPFSFEYSGYNRMQRMTEVCSNEDSITIDMLVDLQTDVMSCQGLELKELILEKVAGNTAPLEDFDGLYWESFVNWDGNYHVDSKSPVAFETMMYFFAAATIELHYPEEYMKSFLMNDDRWLVLLPQLVKHEDPGKVSERLLAAMKEGRKYFEKYDTWGDMHRLVFGSTLARIPLIGKKYKLADIGLGGSTNTLMKTAHTFTPEKHTISYGSNSRHISNMEDIDENYFVLLGGQDGWIKSPHNDDQLELWLNKEYIRMPLRLETVQKEFTYHISNIN
jgi:penicillin amidase